MQDWTAPPRDHLTETQARSSIDWDAGLTYRFGVTLLDTGLTPLAPQPDLDVERVRVDWGYRVPSTVTSRSAGVAAVRRTAAVTVHGDLDFNPLAVRWQPWVETLADDGVWVRWNLGVFIATMPQVRQSSDGTVAREVRLADLTHRWASTETEEHVVAPFNRNVVLFVREDVLIPEFGHSLFDLPATDRVVREEMVFEPGTSWLEVMNAVLEHGGFDPLTVTEDGAARTRLADDYAQVGVEHTYEPGVGSTVLEEGVVDPLLPEMPNVVRFRTRREPEIPEEGNGIYTLRNVSVGPASIQERGYEIVKVVEVEADDQTELEEIGRRDAIRYFAGGGIRAQVRVGLNPRHSDRDVVALVKPRLGLDAGSLGDVYLDTYLDTYGDPEQAGSQAEWLVTSWRMELRSGDPARSATMQLEAERRIDGVPL